MTALWIWLIVAAVCVVAEVLTVNFVFFMVAAGAAAGALADLAGLPVAWQVVIAAVVALAGLFLLRPLMLRHFRPQGSDTATNVDAMIGKRAIAKEVVSSTSGTASVNGEVWSARVADDAPPIASGASARIQRIDGVYLILTTDAPAADPQT